MTPDLSRTTLSRDAILLAGNVALVTGGGAGIGRGIAVGLAEFGADIAILDKDTDAAQKVAALVEAKGRRALPIIDDAINRDAIRAAVERTVAELGAIDILVNNVGGTRPIALVDMTDRQVDRQIDLNLKNLFAATQAAARAMIAAGTGGSIINVASSEGLRAAPCFSVYAACKAGMINFTRTAALELAEHGIRVNAIAPDIVLTEGMVRFAPAMVEEAGRAAHSRYIPLARTGNFDDCAGAAVFLASAMAGYITGVTLNVDGGTWASSGWTRDVIDATRWKLFA